MGTFNTYGFVCVENYGTMERWVMEMIYELVEWTNKKGKKVMRYPKLYGKQRKQEKKTEGSERKKDWDKLTIEQKWNELDKRSGNSAKERERLAKRIEA